MSETRTTAERVNELLAKGCTPREAEVTIAVEDEARERRERAPRRKLVFRAIDQFGGHVGAEGVFFVPLGEAHRIAVVKSDALTQDSLDVVSEGFRERWPDVKLAVFGIGENDSFEVYEEVDDTNTGSPVDVCSDCGHDGVHHCPAADDLYDEDAMTNMASTP